MKYLVIDERKFHMFSEEFETVEEALKIADRDWNCLTEAEKENKVAHFYVLESANPDENAENHFDGNIVKEWK